MQIIQITLPGQVTTDLEGFLAAAEEPDHEETAYTLKGEETDANGIAK